MSTGVIPAEAVENKQADLVANKITIAPLVYKVFVLKKP